MPEDASNGSVVLVFGILACCELGTTSGEIESHVGEKKKQRPVW